MKRKDVNRLLHKMELQSEYSDADIKNIRTLAHSKDYEKRYRVAELLCTCKQKFAEEILLELTQDRNELVRASAVDSIGIGSQPATFDRLRALLEKEQSPLVRSYAVLSYYDVYNNISSSTTSEKTFKKELYSLFDEETDEDVRLSYYEVFIYLGKPEYINQIVSMLENAVSKDDSLMVWKVLHTFERIADLCSFQSYRLRIDECSRNFNKAQRALFERIFRKES